MNIFKAITLGTAVAVMVGGCTSNKKYTALQNRYDELSKDYNASQVALPRAAPTRAVWKRCSKRPAATMRI